MLRRCITYFVIFALLIGQQATIPHAHAGITGAERSEHDAAPHFHLEGDVHHHGHDHHGHDHDDDGHDPGPTDSQHDETAVYVGAEVPTISGSSPIVDLPTLLAFGLYEAISPVIDTTTAQPWQYHERPPDKVLDQQDTYLTLRTLRI